MISLEEARAGVLSGVEALAPGRRPLAEVAGTVLAEEVRAPTALPPFDNSAMDGFAVRAADTRSAPTRLAVVGAVMAGQDRTEALHEGEAVRIMTGAPIPPGADAICMLEVVDEEDDGTVILVHDPVSEGLHVRRSGNDVAEGALVFSPGTALSPAHVGVLASLGIDDVAVVATPRVGVLSTGDELAREPGRLPRGRIRDANRPALLAQLGRDGFEAVDLGIVGDDEDEVVAVITRAAETSDAIVVSGGVSVGDRDVVRLVLEKLGGGAIRWMQVAIKPAKPFAFGALAASGTPLFGLPGNPVSALVSYELFVRPALRRMAGHDAVDRPRTWAVATEALTRTPDGKVHFQRVRAERDEHGEVRVEVSGGQESHMLHGMAQANALAVLPDGPGIEAGGRVEVLLLDADALAPRNMVQRW
jgi:molybdopterin molybdotransferase